MTGILTAVQRAKRPTATRQPRTPNRPSGSHESPSPAYPGSKIDPDTGRDPALYPVGGDEWDTQERGQLTINGVIWGRRIGQVKLPAPFVFFSAEGTGWCYTAHAWNKLMAGARIVRTAEDRIREAGETVPKWSGPPS